MGLAGIRNRFTVVVTRRIAPAIAAYVPQAPLLREVLLDRTTLGQSIRHAAHSGNQ